MASGVVLAPTTVVDAQSPDGPVIVVAERPPSVGAVVAGDVGCRGVTPPVVAAEGVVVTPARTSVDPCLARATSRNIAKQANAATTDRSRIRRRWDTRSLHVQTEGFGAWVIHRACRRGVRRATPSLASSDQGLHQAYRSTRRSFGRSSSSPIGDVGGATPRPFDTMTVAARTPRRRSSSATALARRRDSSSLPIEVGRGSV